MGGGEVERMSIDEIRQRLAAIAEAGGDDEIAHTMEDCLWGDFIEHVAKCGDPELARMAELVLTSTDIKFNRWCA